MTENLAPARRHKQGRGSHHGGSRASRREGIDATQLPGEGNPRNPTRRHKKRTSWKGTEEVPQGTRPPDVRGGGEEGGDPTKREVAATHQEFPAPHASALGVDDADRMSVQGCVAPQEESAPLAGEGSHCDLPDKKHPEEEAPAESQLRTSNETLQESAAAVGGMRGGGEPGGGVVQGGLESHQEAHGAEIHNVLAKASGVLGNGAGSAEHRADCDRDDAQGRRTVEDVPTIPAAGREEDSAQADLLGQDVVDPYDAVRDELRALEQLAADYDTIYNRVESADYEEFRPPEIDGELDHVDVAGHIELESIRQAATNPASPLYVALWALSSEHFAESLVPRGRIFKGTRREYVRFVRTMVECGLCEKVGRSALGKAYSGFFTVLKKEVDGVKILRTILNCEPLNQASPKAPPVNLPSLLEVQDAFANCKFLRALDFRHYFHQFTISRQLQEWLHLAIGPARVRWRVLPMGWTWAPFIAEAISWYFAVGDEVNQWEGLPRVYRNAKGVVVVIWYDNVFAGAQDEEALNEFWDGMLRRCEQHKVVIKEQHRAAEGESIDCIGLKWHVTSEGVKWELLDKSKDKLRAVAATIQDGQLPIKQVAKLIGCVVWGLWSQRKALFQLRDAYELLAQAVKLKGWKGSMLTKGLEELGRLATELADSSSLTGVDPKKKRVYIASDASLSGYGVVDLETGNQIRGVWKCKHETGDMYYLEALAAKRAVAYAPANTEIILLVDNMGLVWSLRKRSTRCPRTARVLAEMQQSMEDRGQSLQVVHIGTEDNPADAPSRGDMAEHKKIRHSRQAADAAIHG